jgi:hypothetical protein
MKAEVRVAEAAWCATVSLGLVGVPPTRAERDALTTVERVAKVVSGIAVIGEARNALSTAGWTATIAANRITVGDDVIAQLIPAKTGTYGPISGRWVIYSIGGADPVWIVGTE